MEKTISDGEAEETISGGTRHSPPWFLISHGEHHEKHSFYNISEQKLYNTSITQLCDKCILESAYGWLVLSDHKTNECCLWNPSTKEIIKLPKLERSFQFMKCTLSKPPTDSDCYILFNSTGGYQAFCRIGDNKYVINQQQHYYNFLRASISFNAEIYGIKVSPFPIFLTVHLNFAEKILELRPLMTEEGEEWELNAKLHPWVKIADYYLVKSLRGDEIFLVKRMSSSVFDQMAFKVFRADFHLKEFVEIYNLGGEAIFLNFNGSGWCSSSQGIQPNCIYYTDEGSRSIYIYDLNDQSTSLVLPCPDASREQFKTYWVQPQVFHP